MNRRGILASVLTAAGGLFAAGATSAKAAPESPRIPGRTPDKTKVVYHLTDFDKVGFALNNIKNHYEGVGGPANVTIALVSISVRVKPSIMATLSKSGESVGHRQGRLKRAIAD